MYAAIRERSSKQMIRFASAASGSKTMGFGLSMEAGYLSFYNLELIFGTASWMTAIVNEVEEAAVRG